MKSCSRVRRPEPKQRRPCTRAAVFWGRPPCSRRLGAPPRMPPMATFHHIPGGRNEVRACGGLPAPWQPINTTISIPVPPQPDAAELEKATATRRPCGNAQARYEVARVRTAAATAAQPLAPKRPHFQRPHQGQGLAGVGVRGSGPARARPGQPCGEDGRVHLPPPPALPEAGRRCQGVEFSF